MQATNRQRLSFSIDGRFLTDHFRTLVLEDSWSEALTGLVDSLLDGFGYDNAIKVLSGRARLEGINTVNLIPEEDHDYIHEVARFYAGRFQMRKILAVHNRRLEWFRPVAYVHSYGREDVKGIPHWMKQEGLSILADRIPFDLGNPYHGARYRSRTWFYCHEGEQIARPEVNQNDPRVLEITRRRWATSRRNTVDFIFEEVKPPPIWLQDRTKTATDAIVEWASFRGNPDAGRWGLEGRGAFDRIVEPTDDERLNQRHVPTVGPGYLKVIPLENADDDDIDHDHPPQYLDWQQRIEAQADAMGEEGWMEIEVAPLDADDKDADLRNFDDPPAIDQPYTLRVAKAPFILYATRLAAMLRPAIRPLPAWNTVCPVGAKRFAYDDPNHTDWVVSAGLGLLECYRLGPEARKAIWKAEQALQDYYCGVKTAVLSAPRLGVVKGRIHHPQKDQASSPYMIAVVPQASPDYTQAALTALAVITETGGPLAHLPIVAREAGTPMVRLPGALAMLQEGTLVEIDTATGEVRTCYPHSAEDNEGT